MNYYNRIQNSIEFIEINLDQNIDIVDIASKAHFSAFHFQRIFQAISGFSVQSYIRKRRMTEAVKSPSYGLESSLVNLEIPKGKYAVFNVDGTVEISQNTWRYIYKTWLPNSNYERREGPDFEITDVCNSMYPDKMKMKIYIPVK